MKRTRDGEAVSAEGPGSPFEVLPPQTSPSGLDVAAVGEEVRLSVPGTSLTVDGTLLGTGSLFVTTTRVVWSRPAAPDAPTPTTALVLALPYPRISLHAVSRDTDSFPSPCIYAQLEGADCDGDGPATLHAYFVPPEPAAQLDALFTALSACAELHADPMEDEEEGDEGGEGDDGAAGGGSGAGSWLSALLQQGGAGEVTEEQQRAVLARLEGMVADNAAAEEDDEAGEGGEED